VKTLIFIALQNNNKAASVHKRVNPNPNKNIPFSYEPLSKKTSQPVRFWLTGVRSLHQLLSQRSGRQTDSFGIFASKFCNFNALM